MWDETPINHKTTDKHVRSECLLMNRAIRVLLIEDDSSYVALVQQWLSHGTESAFVLDWANSLQTGLRHLRPGAVDVILLDLGLPDGGGFETFSKIKQQAGGVPIIVLSGDSTEQLALQLLGTSGHGYLIYKSSSDGDSLAKTIRHAVQTNSQRGVSDQSVRREDRQTLIES
jgi:DNA-binding response OmpR family regulator